MPAPVEFTISLAALTPGFSGDPQALATEIAQRLTISPSEPWSSFVNGGAQPSSNVGPWLKNGNEWWVWSAALGTYTYHSQNGAGLVAKSVPLTALADGSPKSVLTYDASGRPALISGVAGQGIVLDASGLPAFSSPITGNFFVLRASASQDYVADGVHHPVHFNLTSDAVGVTPDLANYRVPIPENSTWQFGASLQIESINGAHTNSEHFVAIRPYQLDAVALGSLDTQPTNVTRLGLQTGGVYKFGAAGYVDVIVASTNNTGGTDYSVSTNGTNTRFWGFRLT